MAHRGIRSRETLAPRLLLALLAAGVLAHGLSASAAAQTGLSKAMHATGTTAGGANVSVTAAVEPGTTAGNGCLWMLGVISGKESWEGGCGELAVIIDEGLNMGHVQGTLTTSYGVYDTSRKRCKGYCSTGTHEVTLEATVHLTGRPGVYVLNWNTQACPPFYTALCLVGQTLNNPDNRVMSREGAASGNVAGSAFGTADFSGRGTLLLQRSAEQS